MMETQGTRQDSTTYKFSGNLVLGGNFEKFPENFANLVELKFCHNTKYYQ